MKKILGIDLGGTFIKGGIVCENGEITVAEQVETEKEKGYEHVIQKISRLCSSLTEKAQIEFTDISAVGIACPGIVDSEKGVVVTNCNLGWKNQAVVNDLGKLTQKRVFLLNDANAAVYGEYKFGEVKFNSAVLLTLGTGIGSGIIKDGKLIDSEYGHMVLRTNGRKCSCGRSGCFERYASATALISDAKKEIKKNPNSQLAKSGIDGKIVFEAYKNGDIAAKKIVDSYVEYLAQGIAKIAFLTNPDLVLIGGGVAYAGGVLFEPLKKAVEKKVYLNTSLLKFKIMPATLGNNAGIYGAAAFALDKTNKKE